jgi:hypothetical protein
MSDGGFILVAYCAASVAFFAVWLVIMSVISGWREMARRFPDRPPRPRAAARAKIRLGRDFMYQYDDVVIGVDESGLHVRQHLLARLGHPPLLFPWSTVDARPAITFWFRPWDVYGLGYYTAIAIPQRSRAAKLLRDYLKTHTEANHP